MNKYDKGLTLIEVLVALTILSIAFLAIIKSTSQGLRNNLHLQQKTIGTWVALSIVNEARLGLLNLPFAPEKIEHQITTLNKHWIYKANKIPTANKNINEIKVEVRDVHTGSVVANLSGYDYAP